MDEDLAGLREWRDRPEFDVDVLLADGTNIVAWPRPSALSLGRPSGRAWRPGLARIAGVLLALLLACALVWRLASAGRFLETAANQTRRVTLADGSVVELSGGTRLEVRFTAALRTVTLHSGEAFFDVRHRAERPFRVHVAGVVIEDLGTRFDVASHADQAAVTVVEGRVEISPDLTQPAAAQKVISAQSVPGAVNEHPRPDPVTELAAGQRARILADGRVVATDGADPASLTTWDRRQLWFDGTPLSEIADQFARYNAVQISVEGARLRTERFSGAFRANDPESFLSYLRRDPRIEIHREGGRITIRDRE